MPVNIHRTGLQIPSKLQIYAKAKWIEMILFSCSSWLANKSAFDSFKTAFDVFMTGLFIILHKYDAADKEKLSLLTSWSVELNLWML